MNRMLLNLARKHQLEYRRRHPRAQADRTKSMRIGYRSYEKVVALIDAGKVEDAVAHWRLHLRNAEATWTGEGEGNRVVDSLGV
jgi:DNA-binding FadR family transcriptional regulator